MGITQKIEVMFWLILALTLVGACAANGSKSSKPSNQFELVFGEEAEIKLAKISAGPEADNPNAEVDEVICRERRVTGSRLKTKSECAYASDWERVTLASRQKITELEELNNTGS